MSTTIYYLTDNLSGFSYWTGTNWRNDGQDLFLRGLIENGALFTHRHHADYLAEHLNCKVGIVRIFTE